MTINELITELRRISETTGDVPIQIAVEIRDITGYLDTFSSENVKITTNDKVLTICGADY